MRPWLLLSMILAVLLPLLVPAKAEAVRFGRPFEGTFNMGSGFDNNGRAGTCTDYNCGGRCYDGHTGTDYPMPLGTRIVSPANGTVTGVVFAGCADYGSLGNTCGGRCGNHVALRWDDGTTSVLCHMRSGTIPVSSGQRVSCGQYLGQSASSGSSTGPHLHFGWRRSSGSTDVYAGSCTGSPGAWVDQGAYWGHPGTGCERLGVRGQQLPGNRDFLHVALTVSVNREHLFRALRLGIFDFALVEILAELRTHYVSPFAIFPAVPMGHQLLARRVGRDGAELQAVALEAHVALHTRVVEWGRILPSRQHV